MLHISLIGTTPARYVNEMGPMCFKVDHDGHNNHIKHYSINSKLIWQMIHYILLDHLFRDN